jgi:hypothetical protein
MSRKARDARQIDETNVKADLSSGEGASVVSHNSLVDLTEARSVVRHDCAILLTSRGPTDRPVS